MLILLKNRLLYLVTFVVLVFYATPLFLHWGTRSMDWAFGVEEARKDPFLRGLTNETAAAPPSVPISLQQKNSSKKKTYSSHQIFGPVESNKSFELKEQSSGTLWIVAKNSAAHQFVCKLISRTPQQLQLNVLAFEQGCEVRYKVGKVNASKIPLEVIVENKSGTRLLSENQIILRSGRVRKTY